MKNPTRLLKLPPRSPGWILPFCKLAIANTASNLMVPLAGLIDTAFLGHLDSIRHLNGVAIASIIFNVIYWSFNFFRMGTTGPVAQAVGRGEQATVWLIGVRNTLLALVAGLLILLLHQPIAALGFGLLEAGPGVRAAAIAFYNGRILGAPAVLINFVLLGWLLGRSQGRQVMLLAVIGNGSNIALDYWFIQRLGLESYGAGLATALSQYIMLAAGVGLLCYEGIPWALWAQIRPRLWQTDALRSLFSLNRDILIRTFALVIAMSLFTNFSSGLGEAVLGVNTLLLQVFLMSAHFMDGIAIAVESYAGQFYGRQAKTDLTWLLLFGSGASVALGTAIALVLMIWPKALFGLLTRHDSLLNQVPVYLPWLLPVLCFGAVAFVLDGYFLGLTASRTLRKFTLWAVGVGYLPMAIAAVWLHNAHLLWLALASLMIARSVTLGWQVNFPTLLAAGATKEKATVRRGPSL